MGEWHTLVTVVLQVCIIMEEVEDVVDLEENRPPRSVVSACASYSDFFPLSLFANINEQ